MVLDGRIQGPLAFLVSPQLVESEGSLGVVRLADSPSGRGVVGAEPAFQQISFGQLKPVTFLHLVELFLGRLGRLVVGARFFFLRNVVVLFLRPSAQFFEGIVVQEVLVPRYLSWLTLLPGPLPRVRLPLGALDR